MRLAFHAVGALFASAVLASPLELRVLNVSGKAEPGTVVVLRSNDPARPLARPVDAQIDQIDRQFKPSVLVVPTGSRVSFPNSDSVSHQVYSFSVAKKFEVPLYRGTQHPPSEKFDRAGVVTLGCNIHDNMRAYLFVVDAQYFGRTDPDGSWKSPDVQPGGYTVQIWHPKSREAKPVINQTITVTAAEPRMTLRIVTKLNLRPESQVPANWDAY
ncbi:MAG: methylamine utilization protein [Steroidobacteraceae bacterium]